MGIKISALPAAGAADSAMQFEVNNAGTSQRLTLAQMFALSMAAVTVDTPLLNMAQTWNAGGVTFNGWKLNITDTASAAASKLLDLQVGGASKFSVTKAGVVTLPAGSKTAVAINFGGAAGTGLYSSSGGTTPGFGVAVNGVAYLYTADSSSGVNIHSGWGYCWGSTAADTTADLCLLRDAANTLAQRNGTSAQSFNLYGTFTDGSNYERGFFRYSTGAGAYLLGSEKAGTGSARNVSIYRDGTEHILCNGSVVLGRNLIFATDNTYDLGASGATRPRTGYFGTSLFVGANQVVSTRATGWTAATGTPTRTTFATGSVTLSQLAEHVKALIDDLITHGLIGA